MVATARVDSTVGRLIPRAVKTFFQPFWAAFMKVKKLDLNLLLVFDAIMSEGNLTRAGLQLGLSQPAMSRSLGKLREVTGDPLFIKVPSGLQPTTFALEITPEIRGGIEMLHGALRTRGKFEPIACNRQFNILMSDLGEVAYLPKLIERLSSEAPNVRFRVLQMPRELYREALSSGEADLAIGHLPGLKEGCYQQRLFEGHHVCLVRQDHPRVLGKLTESQFCSELHILVEPANSRYRSSADQSSTSTFIARFLETNDLDRRIGLTVPHFTVVPELVRQTDLLAVIPSLALRFTRSLDGLRKLELPLKPPVFRVHQYWHARNHRDAAHKWLRSIIAELFLDLHETSSDA
ncbi:MAG: LysR family transcriptional regulator [Pigmentiphaga sp.]|nr:LysR family transcriptional regulator [Pigmentiphaga sp.]